MSVNYKKYLIIGLLSILIIFGINISIKCSQLEKENARLKIEQKLVSDSIKIENEFLRKEIVVLLDDLNQCELTIDTLKQIKQKIIVRTEYVVSEDLTESVIILKENLKCEKY